MSQHLLAPTPSADRTVDSPVTSWPVPDLHEVHATHGSAEVCEALAGEGEPFDDQRRRFGSAL